MKFSRFLKDKMYVVFLSLICYVIILLIFFAFKINIEVIISISIIYIFLILTILLIDYYRKKNFYTDLIYNIEALDKGYLVLETLQKPDFYEGELIMQPFFL